jgi:hypothetical protein
MHVILKIVRVDIHEGIPFMTWTVNTDALLIAQIHGYLLGWHSQRDSISDETVKTGALFIAQTHGYLLGLKSIKTLIVDLQKV